MYPESSNTPILTADLAFLCKSNENNKIKNLEDWIIKNNTKSEDTFMFINGHQIRMTYLTRLWGERSVFWDNTFPPNEDYFRRFIERKKLNKISKIDRKILNICRSKPIITMDLVKLILKIYNAKNPKLKKTKFVKGEMLKTHGSNKKISKIIGKKHFEDIKKSIDKTINWHKKVNY